MDNENIRDVLEAFRRHVADAAARVQVAGEIAQANGDPYSYNLWYNLNEAYTDYLGDLADLEAEVAALDIANP
jgi:hypothetical protein